MESLQVYSMIWSLIEAVLFLGVCALFIIDPIRRWNFFGYRPTAIMAIFDPKHRKLLLVRKENDTWFSFSQGGIYDPDLNFSSKEIIKRELGFDETKYSLRHTQTLGTVRIRDREYNKRCRINTISIVSSLRGKGYIACYIRANLADIGPHIILGEDINEYKIFSLEEARHAILSTQEGKEMAIVKKQKLLVKVLNEIETIFAKVEKKHQQPECAVENSQKV